MCVKFANACVIIVVAVFDIITWSAVCVGLRGVPLCECWTFKTHLTLVVLMFLSDELPADNNNNKKNNNSYCYCKSNYVRRGRRDVGSNFITKFVEIY